MPHRKLITLLHRHVQPVKHLPGFQKRHRVPSSATASDSRFVQGLVEPLVDEELQQVFGDLRREYGLKRKELAVDGPYEGGGQIETPFFTYRIQVELDPVDPANVLWVRSVSEIREVARLIAGPFEQVFGGRFSVLEYRSQQPLDLEAIVDTIEEADPQSVQLDYDKDLQWCRIQPVDAAVTVHVTESTIELHAMGPATAQQLLEAFAWVEQELSEALGPLGEDLGAGS